MIGIFVCAEDSVFDGEETKVKIRTRIGAGAKIRSVTDSASGINIGAKRNVGGTSERLVISG